MTTKTAAAIVLLLFVPLSLRSAPDDGAVESPKPHRRIGLALAGGGAKGLSHVGVLQWLEEHRVPVDYIAGTSMGGLIGGLFASGRDSTEMIDFFDSIDWIDILRGAPDYSELSFRRKEDERAYPNQIELGFRKGIRVPVRFNSGHKIGLLVDRIAFPYSNLVSFDELPTPFRCVAADLVTAEQVIFKTGSLSLALRATMSIPGIFEPVRDENRLLVDGGILNNLPIDVVKGMGADLVIAVDLGYPQPKVEEIDSLLGVVSRSFDVMIEANVSRNLKLADVILRPDLRGYDTFSFDAAKEIIARGYQAAELRAQALVPLALDEASWQEYLSNRRSRRRGLTGQPEFVQVEGASVRDRASVDKLLKNEIGGPLNVEKLDAALTQIAGWGRYESAGYRQEFRDGQEGLAVEVRPKSYGPPFLKPSLEINGAQVRDIKFTLAGRLTFYDVLQSNAEWRTDLSAGFQNLAATELYRPLGQTGFFVAPKGRASRVIQNVYLDGGRALDYIVDDTRIGIDVGYALGTASEFRLGYDLGRQRGHLRNGDSQFPSFTGRVSSLTAQWQLERLDDPVLPTRGLRIKSQAWWYLDAPGNGPAFPQAETRALFAQPLNRRLSALLSFQGGTSFGKTAPFPEKFILGGPVQLGALNLQELRGNHYFYASAGLLQTLSDKPAAVLGKISAIAYYEVGDAFDSKANAFNDVAAGLLSRTKLGILFFGGSVGESGRHKFYFSLGRFF